MESIVVGGRSRSFVLHLPNEPEGKPLLIALHPLGSNPLLMEAMTGFSDLADKEGFIAVYPEGTKASSVGVRSWNAMFCCGEAMANDVDDIGFLEALIDLMTDRYRVRGVLVTGFSNGGMLAHLAGIMLSTKVDAIAPVAATVGSKIIEHCPSRPVPALFIHGDADYIVPYGFSRNDRHLPTADAVGYWVKCNGCSPTPSIAEKDGVVKARYIGASEGDVTVYTVKGAGHVWPGSKVRMRSENDPRTLDASKAIWEFFSGKLA